MSIEVALSKLRSAQICHPNAVQFLIDEAINAIQQAEAHPPASPGPVQTTPNFTQLMQILDGLNRCHSRDSKVEFLRSWIRDWTQHKVDKLTHPAPSVPADIDALIHRVSVAICLSHSAWDLADARVLVLEILKQAGPH